MKRIQQFSLVILILFCGLALSCGESTPGATEEEDPKPPTEEEVDILPNPQPLQLYTPSLNSNHYRPIMVDYAAKEPVTSWNSAMTRIVPYMEGFTPDTTINRYRLVTNKYGSRTDKHRQPATGRFYTKKINGRWWIIDPEGYIHYQRSVTSFRKGSSTRNGTAWNNRFQTDEQWLETTQKELALIGFHGTGAFCTNTYPLIQAHNQRFPERPLTLAPSFGFLSNFKSKSGYEYPGGTSANAAGLVFYSGWEAFCTEYCQTALAPYLLDPNVLGFFSDNEIDFSSANSYILSRFLDIANPDDPARLAAINFMETNHADAVTSSLNSAFAGLVAEKYYKGIKDAIRSVDPGMIYLGSRLHGTPKYLKEVIEAAGRHCDIISINYYSRWSVELDSKVQEWGIWADAPFMVTEFYTKGMDSDLPNTSGAGYLVRTQKERAYAYQHFTLGLLEAKNCVGWHWFKYQDDDGKDNNGQPANKGLYNNYYEMYPYLSKYMKTINLNVYELIEYFDNP